MENTVWQATTYDFWQLISLDQADVQQPGAPHHLETLRAGMENIMASETDRSLNSWKCISERGEKILQEWKILWRQKQTEAEFLEVYSEREHLPIQRPPRYDVLLNAFL
jgi:hypothetical protein